MDDRIGAAIAGAQQVRARPCWSSRSPTPAAPTLQLAAATGPRPERRPVLREPADLGVHPAEGARSSRSTSRRPCWTASGSTTRRGADRRRDPARPADRRRDRPASTTSSTPSGTRRSSAASSAAYSTRLVLVQAVLFLAAAIILTRKGRSDRAPAAARAARPVGRRRWPSPPRPSRRSSPTSCPWWRSDLPARAFWWSLLGWIALITVAALVGPWRQQPARARRPRLRRDRRRARGRRVHRLDPGDRLPDGRPPAPRRAVLRHEQPGVRAAHRRRGCCSRSRSRTRSCAAVGVGWRPWFVAAASGCSSSSSTAPPGLGSDFGGPPALILAFAMLTIVVSGRKVNWKALALIAADRRRRRRRLRGARLAAPARRPHAPRPVLRDRARRRAVGRRRPQDLREPARADVVALPRARDRRRRADLARDRRRSAEARRAHGHRRLDGRPAPGRPAPAPRRRCDRRRAGPSGSS